MNTEYEAIDSSGNKSEHPITDSIHLKLYKSSVNTIALMKELDITSRAVEKIKGLNIGEKVITDPVKTRFITEKLLFEINDTTDYEKTILREAASLPETTDAKVSVQTVKKGTYDGYGCAVDIRIDNSYHSPYIKCTQEEYNWLIS